jgi:aminoglycoside/choline kinase family phosphotransferase
LNSDSSFHPATSREHDLMAWLEQELGGAAFSIAPASADASFRRYFRISGPAGLGDEATRIVMDAPPPQEDCRPFIHVAGLLTEAGLNAPRIFAQDVERGFLLLSDLGTQTYLNAMNADGGKSADALFVDAIDALIRWQLASKPGVLPPYDEALLTRELNLFPDWYIDKHLKRTLTGAQRDVLNKTFARILAANLSQASVFVHRDYMPRNLMISRPNPGVLDFQDAVYGPISYDVASLFKDAFLSWEEERVLDWVIRYWEKARKAGLPVPADFGAFYRDFEWMGLQRHLKVLGIFARINYRDGKPHYLADTPRFVGYVRAVCARYDELAPLLNLMDELHDAAPAQVGYTF